MFERGSSTEIHGPIMPKKGGRKRFDNHKNESSAQFIIGDGRSLSPSPGLRNVDQFPTEVIIVKRDLTPIPTIKYPNDIPKILDTKINSTTDKRSESPIFKNFEHHNVERMFPPLLKNSEDRNLPSVLKRENVKKPFDIWGKSNTYNSKSKYDLSTSPEFGINEKPKISSLTGHVIVGIESNKEKLLKALLYQPKYTKQNPKKDGYDPITGFELNARSSPERRTGMNDYAKMMLQVRDRPSF